MLFELQAFFGAGESISALLPLGAANSPSCRPAAFTSHHIPIPTPFLQHPRDFQAPAGRESVRAASGLAVPAPGSLGWESPGRGAQQLGSLRLNKAVPVNLIFKK